MEDGYDSQSPTRKGEKDDQEDDYDSEDDDDYGGVTIKGASQYLSYQPREKK